MVSLFSKLPIAIAVQSLLMGVIIAGSAHASIKNDGSSKTTRYLDPSIWHITVTDKDCFKAAPRSLLQIEPVVNEMGNRVYKVFQYFDADKERALYATPLSEQIKNHKIIGREFCAGIVSMSNMDIPFSRNNTIQDENDGLLLTDEISRNMNQISMNINRMIELAVQASSGTYSSSQLMNMDTVFQAELTQVEKIAETAQFNGINILDGSKDVISVPTHSGLFVDVPLVNLTTGVNGLNISSLSIYRSSNAQNSLSTLIGNTAVYTAYANVKAARIKLKDDANEASDTVMVDVTNDDFLIQHKKGPRLKKPNNTDTIKSVLSSSKKLPQHPVVASKFLKKNKDDCYIAPSECLIAVTPSSWNAEPHEYNIEQICDYNKIQLMYSYIYSLKNQVTNRKFLGNKLCHGVVTISDMNLPVAKIPFKLMDANDGLLLMKYIENNLDDISHYLNEMKALAEKATSNVLNQHDLDILNVRFQGLLSEINYIANGANFNGMNLLNGSNFFIYIPISENSEERVAFYLPNLTIGQNGLGIASLSLTSNANAANALSPLSHAINEIADVRNGYESSRPRLEAGAKSHETVTTVDLSGPQFVVHKEKTVG